MALVLVGVTPTPARAVGEPPWATGASQADDLRISLLTFGPGDDIPAWFGHSALVVEDRERHHARVYNYGMFDFGSDMLVKFATGRLVFWVGQASLRATLRHYERANRSIRLQVLNLPPAQRMEVAEFLAWNVRPENRDYLYDHYFDNCATRIRDVIDDAVDGQLAAATAARDPLTLREHTRRHAQHSPYIDFVMMLWMNDSIDEPIRRWDAMFLPERVAREIAQLSYTDAQGRTRELVQNSRTLFAADRPPVPETPNAGWLRTLLAGTVLAAGGLLLATAWRRSRRRAWRVAFGLYNAAVGGVVGLPGLLLVTFWFTDHTITHFNENALMANPLTFLALPFGGALAFGAQRVAGWLRWSWWALAIGTALAVLLQIVPGFNQANAMVIAGLWPLNWGMAVAWWLAMPAYRGRPADAQTLVAAASGSSEQASA